LERGIEANPNKFQAILNMKSSPTIKEVQKLTGRLTGLLWFKSKVVEKAQTFFSNVLKMKKPST
jgi:hypothetical protein